MRKMVERQSLIDKLTKKVGFTGEDALLISTPVYIESLLEVENEIITYGPITLEGVTLLGSEINHYRTKHLGSVNGGDEILIGQSINLLYPFTIEFTVNSQHKKYVMWLSILDRMIYWHEEYSGDNSDFSAPNLFPPFCDGISVGNLHELEASNCVITIDGQYNLKNVVVTYYCNNSDLVPHLMFQAGVF